MRNASRLFRIEIRRPQTDSCARLKTGKCSPRLDTTVRCLDAKQFRQFVFSAHEGSSSLQVRVFYHDKCFDGACSASLFTRFHRECIAPGASYEYHGLVHRARRAL
jgi:hypothetical protein